MTLPKARTPEMRHTRALPRSSRWERLYFRIMGHQPQSVVNRRMEALALDEQERDAWIRDNAEKAS